VIAAVVALGMVVALLGVLVVGMLRSHADVLRVLHDLGIGEDQLAGEAAAENPSAGTVRAAGADRSAGRAQRARQTAASSRTATDPGIRTVDGVAAPGETSALGRLADIDGVDPHGGAVRIGLRAGAGAGAGTTLLAFLSTGCGTCQDFWRAFGTDEIDAVPGGDTRVVVVTRGPEEESPAAVADLAPDRVTTVMSSAAWDAYDVPLSPYFLLVDGTRGVVGEGASASWAQVVDLLGKAAADAGLALAGGPARLSRRDLLRAGGNRDREVRADRELAAAGIEPGSPALYEPVHDPTDSPAGAGAADPAPHDAGRGP
jgi:hypothetical protein